MGFASKTGFTGGSSLIHGCCVFDEIFEGIIHFELVPSNRSINGRFYGGNRLSAQSFEDSLVYRKRILFQHNDALVYCSRVVKQKLNELGEIKLYNIHMTILRSILFYGSIFTRTTVN